MGPGEEQKLFLLCPEGMGLKREGRAPLLLGPWEELLEINQGKRTEEIAFQ